MFDIPALMERLNYPITIRGENCVVPSYLRGGDNPLAIFVNASGICHDQVQNRNFTLAEFVAEVLGCSIKAANEFIGSSQTAAPQEKEVKLEVDKKFDIKHIAGLTASYKYYLDKGISKKTLEEFKGGLCHSGKLYLRFVFPIYNKAGKVLGAAGRDVSYNKEQEKEFTAQTRPRPKWKILGEKKTFTYPLFISSKYIDKTRQIVLVESIGDALSLWNSGIKNTFCLFGVSLSDPALMAIAAENPKEILLALNNDFASKVNRGAEGAAKVRTKLKKLFSLNAIKEAFPIKNDFGEQTIEENQAWANTKGVRIFHGE